MKNNENAMTEKRLTAHEDGSITGEILGDVVDTQPVLKGQNGNIIDGDTEVPFTHEEAKLHINTDLSQENLVNPHRVLSPGRDLISSHGGLFGELEMLQIQCEKTNRFNLASEIQCLLSNLGAVKVHAQSIEQRYGKELQEIESLLKLFS